MKICTKCKQEFKLENYHKDKTSQDGLYSNCKNCKRQYRRSIINQMLNNAKRRAKDRNIDFDLDLDFLYYLKNKQNNKCAITGVELNWTPMPVSKQRECPPDRASLDKINPKKGYIKTNVQLVTDFSNRMKYTYSIEEILRFCKLVSNNNN